MTRDRRSHVDEDNDPEIIRQVLSPNGSPNQGKPKQVRFEEMSRFPWGIIPPAAGFCLVMGWSAQEFGATGFISTSFIGFATLTFGYNNCQSFQNLVLNATENVAKTLSLK